MHLKQTTRHNTSCSKWWEVAESLPGRQLVTNASPWTLDTHSPNITTMVALCIWLIMYFHLTNHQIRVISRERIATNLNNLSPLRQRSLPQSDLNFHLYFHLYTCPLFHLRILPSLSFLKTLLHTYLTDFNDLPISHKRVFAAWYYLQLM